MSLSVVSATNGLTVVSSGTEIGIVSLSGNGVDDEDEVLVGENDDVLVVTISR